jgi:hypothetical protein
VQEDEESKSEGASTRRRPRQHATLEKPNWAGSSWVISQAKTRNIGWYWLVDRSSTFRRVWGRFGANQPISHQHNNTPC